MSHRLLPPIRSSFSELPDLEPEIDAFIYGLGELVDSFQDAEAAGQTVRLQDLALRLAERASQLGFSALSVAAEGIRAACKSEDPHAARKAVQELTELAQRVRRGHRSAAS